jgi:hypothetical protein
LAVTILAGCRPPTTVDPAPLFQNIRTEFLHGNLAVAQQQAEKARNEFSASDASWGMKFRLLEAEILTYQGRRPEVIALLNSPGVTYPNTGDLAIKRNLLCGLAHAKLGQESLSDTELREAQQVPTERRGLAYRSHRSALSKPLTRGCGPCQKKFAGCPGTTGFLPGSE